NRRRSPEEGRRSISVKVVTDALLVAQRSRAHQPSRRAAHRPRIRMRRRTSASYMIFYDISRDGIGLAPILFTLAWLAALVAGITLAIKSGIGRRFLYLWLVVWATMGGAGFGNIWYQHFRRLRELESGHYRVVEGRVTS